MHTSRVYLIVIGLVLAMASGAQAQTREWHGLTFKTLTAETAEENGLLVFDGALVTEVSPKSPARKNLAPGDAIVSAGRRPVNTAADLEAILADLKAGKAVSVVRMRSGAAPKRVQLARPLPAPLVPPRLSSAPTLMLDTGGHMAIINDVIFTPDGQHLISAADDKVMRVWDLRTGKTVRMFRGEVEPGHPGKVFAMALSLDGRWLAAGGWLKEPKVRGHHIRIYDYASGQLVRLLRGHGNVVLDLAFSADGRQLISGDGERGVMLWHAPKGRDGKADWARGKVKHRLDGHSGRIYSVGFLPNGKRAVSASYDKTLRVWDTDTGETQAYLIGHKRKLFALAVRRDGTIVSSDNGGGLLEWPAHAVANATGGIRITASRVLAEKSKRSAGSMVFDPSGQRLLTTGGEGYGAYESRIWNMPSGKVILRYPGHNNTVRSSAWSADGRWIATGGGGRNVVRLWSPKDGAPRRGDNGEPLVLSGSGRPIWGTGISADGNWIGWGNTWRAPTHKAQNPIEFAIRLPSERGGLGSPVQVGTSNRAVPTNFRRAALKSGRRSLLHRKGGSIGQNALLDIREGDRILATIERRNYQGASHRSYSFTADRKTIISGSAYGEIHAYDVATVLKAANGGTITGDPLDELIKPYIGHESVVWAVTPSKDGRLLVSGSDDQTVRIWNLKTGELIVTLFHAPTADGGVGEWVMWTPQGFYTGSPGGGRIVGWQINNGAGKTADYVTGGQLRKTLNRKDIIEEAIRLRSARAAVAKLAPDHNLGRVLAARAPELTLATPEPYSTEFRGSKTVTTFVKAGSFAIERYEIAVNGSKVRTERAPVPRNHPRPPKDQTVEAFSIPLANGENDIEIRAFSPAGESRPVRLRVTHNGEGPLDQRGTLHVVAIGIDKYPGLGKTCGSNNDATCDLTYAGKDAKLFANTIRRELGPRHKRGVKIRLLTNGGRRADQPTAANILKAIEDAVSEGPIDTVAVFIAGHGETGKNGNYYLLPTDIRRRGGFKAVGTGRNIIDWSKIQDRLTKSRGRMLIFLDSCQSGAAGSARAYNARLLEDARYENFVAFMAAGPNQYAIERPDLGHGLFTHALALGMAGAAKRAGERTVRVTPLGSYIAERVRQLSSGLQVPVYSSHHDFVLVAK